MAEPYKIYKLDGGDYFDVSKHPDTLRIEVYWRNKGRWGMVANSPIMVDEATRLLKGMVKSITTETSPLQTSLVATTPKQKKLWEKQYPGVKVYLSKKLPK